MVYAPTVSASLANGSPSDSVLLMSWSVNYNGGTSGSTAVALTPTAGGAAVYTSTSTSGSSVSKTGLSPNTSYTLTVEASAYYSAIGEWVTTTRTAVLSTFYDQVKAWNGTAFIPVTSVKAWNGSAFVSVSVKVNTVAGSTPTWVSVA